MSVASVSALGGGRAKNMDIKIVERINHNVHLMLTSRMPLDMLILLASTFK